ncbi:putative inactive shikimate kinase like 2, chloroplastic [Vitis vinifera]|uniref:Putative inactive shikimate kinase like 2, chloroplastic n=1 Tax=Vitis vinifera TaxID=29760 RepID=A0A438EQ70_VITVI|nr:putative inactive shikimate kinase like 2, chloroplastic [Vitis vinifera]
MAASLFFFSQNPFTSPQISHPKIRSLFSQPTLTLFTPPPFISNNATRRLSCKALSTISLNPSNYEFSDASSEMELRLQLGGGGTLSSRDIFVDAEDSSLKIGVKQSGSFITLVEINKLYEKIKSSETIWYIDEDQLVVNLKKQDPDLKWPDIVESWESLTAGAMQLLKGTSIYIVGDSTEINDKVARELAVGLGYTPLNTKELLETFAKQSIDHVRVTADGSESVAEAESAVLENLSSHVRAVIATLGGLHGAARRADKWRHLYAGFTVWLSQSESIDEESAKEEARRHIQEGSLGYSNADVVVKLHGWDADHAKTVAQASLSALKQLIMSDKKLPGNHHHMIETPCMLCTSTA